MNIVLSTGNEKQTIQYNTIQTQKDVEGGIKKVTFIARIMN